MTQQRPQRADSSCHGVYVQCIVGSQWMVGDFESKIRTDRDSPELGRRDRYCTPTYMLYLRDSIVYVQKVYAYHGRNVLC